MSAPVAGLFGKLPAHGDFVRRGWEDDTVAALDGWLTGGVAALRAMLDDDGFAAAMRVAPMWHAFIPGAVAGGLALRLALAPSIDRAGRMFFLAAGVAGDDGAVWGRLCGSSKFAERLDAAVYDALAGTLDADAVVARLDEGGVAADAAAPSASCWWPGVPEMASAPAIEADRLDAALLVRLVRGKNA